MECSPFGFQDEQPKKRQNPLARFDRQAKRPDSPVLGYFVPKSTKSLPERISNCLAGQPTF